MHVRLTRAALAACLLLSCGTAGAAADDSRATEELRNTVINLLQNLVDRGVLTREQAEKIVRDAQGKAEVEAAAAAAQAQAEESAVRIPYVPEIVKEEIRRQVATDLGEQVRQDVVQAARDEGWGVPAALPDWVRRMRWFGDLRVREQQDLFASNNVLLAYRDFQRINDAGGEQRAGLAAFTNVSEDRDRLRIRLRFGFETVLGYGWNMGARLATGSLSDATSTNQTLGMYGARNTIGLDLAWLDWQHTSSTGRQQFGFTGGRMRNPFFTASELVYDQDLTFEGIALSYRSGLQVRDPAAQSVFVSGGIFPLQEVELSGHDKYLAAGQLGLDWKYTGGSRTRVGASWHRFINVAGKRNQLDSRLLDYTAPQVIRRGNTVFDIRNDNDTTTNLYALAADFDLLNVSLVHDLPVSPGKRITFAADYVRNIGYSKSAMLARGGFIVPERSEGYHAEVAFNSSTIAEPGATLLRPPHAWRAAIAYRRVERDAVLDAFTDSDFRLGGTDAKGFIASFDYGLSANVQARLRYLSGQEIDGLPLGINVVQFDITASF